MTKLKIRFPLVFTFTCQVPVRITDLNYGGHVGNDAMFSIIQEARVKFLEYFGYGELEFGGLGLIMANAAIEFKSEMFHGDIAQVDVGISEMSNISFDLYYHLRTETSGNSKTVALARTGMVCYDYKENKIAPIPEEARKKLSVFITRQIKT